MDLAVPTPAQAVPLPATGERELGDQRQRTIESGPTPLLPTDLRDRSHPGNAAFQRTLGEVYRMEDGQGIPHGPHSEKVAAALLVEAERNKQGITNVEMRTDGQVEGIARYNAFESEKRVSVNPQSVQSGTMEAYAAQWSKARSPHYASNAPAAERTPEQTQALALLSPMDRQMFDKIRSATPAHLSDDIVANVLYAAKQDGIADASKVASVDMVGDRLVVNGTTPGFRGVVDVSQPAPPMQETTQQALAFNQQQAITQQQDEAQRQQRTQETNTRTV
ncbi:XVIPCD domain-containing protein [Xanthomonas graminis]|uniref:XVIPCD domain-containing protein n=2 Tax=Xanthomonas graminis TaxID=3390026 RepID=UPI001E2CA880|nr:XVIPCD domain-containing protein [Xanthomonas translucens]